MSKKGELNRKCAKCEEYKLLNQFTSYYGKGARSSILYHKLTCKKCYKDGYEYEHKAEILKYKEKMKKQSGPKYDKHSNTCFVYAFLRPNYTPFYIGMGQLERIGDHSRTSRNKSWWKEMEQLNFYYIFIVIDNELTYTQANEIEKAHIKKFGRKGIDKNGILTNKQK